MTTTMMKNSPPLYPPCASAGAVATATTQTPTQTQDVFNDKPSLDFQSIGHVGREVELRRLVALVEEEEHQEEEDNNDDARVKQKQSQKRQQPQPNNSKPAGILLEAESGVGKSALLKAYGQHLMAANETHRSCPPREEKAAHIPSGASSLSGRGSIVLCQAKFEERVSAAADEPFCTICVALNELLDAMLDDWMDTRTQPQELSHALSPNADILLTILPRLRDLLPRHSHTGERGEEGNVSHEGSNNNNDDDDNNTNIHNQRSPPSVGLVMDQDWRFERLRLAIRALVRYVVQQMHMTVVWLVDDIHWADADSLQVLRTLLQDTAISSTKTSRMSINRPAMRFLLVAACRPMEPYRLLRNLFHDVPRHVLKVQGVSRLDTAEVAVLLQRLLSSGQRRQHQGTEQRKKRSNVMPLAECLRDYSNGNAFVLLQYLRWLEQERLFIWDEESSQWVWNLMRVRQSLGRHLCACGEITAAFQSSSTNDAAIIVQAMVEKSIENRLPYFTQHCPPGISLFFKGGAILL